MLTPTNQANNIKNNAGFAPAPAEPHKKANFEGQERSVTLNGSKILMRFVNGKWWNVQVKAA